MMKIPADIAIPPGETANRMMSSSGVALARFGLGCWPIGGDEWGIQDDAQSIAAIRKAMELGVTHFDTAQAYGRGHGEEILGNALPNDRSHLFIATKLLFTAKEKIETALLYSLKRLRCKTIDLVYIHWPEKGADIAGMMEGLENVRRKGIIRYIGVSNFSVSAMEEVMKAGVIDVYQLGYSLLWRKGEREIIPFCGKNGIRIITYGSLAEGILTGKFGKAVLFAKNDHRRNTLLFDQMIWPLVYDTIEEMKTVAGEAGVSLTACAIQWLLRMNGVTAILFGARNPEQVAQNSAAVKEFVPGKVLDSLTQISDRLLERLPDEENVFRWYP
jgi:myo-inositol catabolism protein IolS